MIALADDETVAKGAADAMAETANRLDLAGRATVVKPVTNGARVIQGE